MTQKFVNELDLIKMHHCAMPALELCLLYTNPLGQEKVSKFIFTAWVAVSLHSKS